MITVSKTAGSPYEEHRGYVLRVLARRCAWLDRSDHEALLHDAYAVFLEKQGNRSLDALSMQSPQVRAYLTQTALNKAMDEGKRAARTRSVPLNDEQLGLESSTSSADVDERLAASLDNARMGEIIAELPDRQRLVVRLRFFLDRTPHEIQRYLGITERVYRRELERGMRHISARYRLVLNGSFCESRRSLILAYATGVAGPSRRVQAQRHLRSCPGCARWAADLRVSCPARAA